MLSQFAQLVPLSGTDPLDEESGVIALVGPTGAGKTTTIAKLASQYAETHGTRDVAMITTDTARIGAREHLYGYGRQMGIAVHEVNENVSLQDALARVAGYKLVLIDTTGISQRDRALAIQLNWLKGAGNVRTLLTIPANMHPADIDTISRFAPVAPAGVVLTKLDETARLGAALSAIIQRACRCNGSPTASASPKTRIWPAAPTWCCAWASCAAATKPRPGRGCRPCRMTPILPRAVRPAAEARKPMHPHAGGDQRQGRRRQDRHRHQPRRGAGPVRPQDPADGCRPRPGQRRRAARPHSRPHAGRPGRRPLHAR
jgi:energy-coupling factor transporter ATP-binding protein EcfA2